MVVNLSRKAQRMVSRLPAEVQQRLRAALAELGSGGIAGQKLQRSKDQAVAEFALRVGKYRVIYQRRASVVEIIALDSRGQVYQR